MRKARLVHVIGSLILAIGAAGTVCVWWLVLSTEGVHTNRTLAVVGPSLAIVGVSMLLFPHLWAGPDGSRFPAYSRRVGVPFAVGLLIGLGNLTWLELLKGEWDAIRRSPEVFGKELLALVNESNEILGTIRDRDTAEEAVPKLKRQAERAARLRERADSLRQPMREEKDWLAHDFQPAIDAGITRLGESMPPPEDEEAFHLTGEILKSLLGCLERLLGAKPPGVP